MKLENPSVHATTLEHFGMPFTANRAFKAAPRLLAKADGMYYWTPEGRQVLDGTAGLWCVNAGHNRKPIVEAVQRQAATMDYAPPFSMAHPIAFEAATAVAKLAPTGMQRVFFTNSGSESADTAIKMALAYHRAGRLPKGAMIKLYFGGPGQNFAASLRAASGTSRAQAKAASASAKCTMTGWSPGRPGS